jgi:glycerol-3-phosphate acyltransferase PlsX
MKIGIDVMGGDYAPQNIVLGAADSLSRISSGSEITLIGDKPRITEICRQSGIDVSLFSIAHTSQVIRMDEHPVQSYQSKKDSSLVVGFGMLKKGEIDAFSSAGNTGAMLTGCYATLNTIPGIMRPCISAEMPLINGKKMLILDVGFNTDCKPDMLYQFGLLGAIYAREMMGIDNPGVALLNIGEEEDKGDMVAREAYKLMSGSTHYRFCGNIEANRLFLGEIADVVVTDGFAGNVLLKQAEGMYDLAHRLEINNTFFERFNYENYGGTPVLGITAPVIIGHGASSPLAVTNMILQAESALNNKLVDKFIEAISYGN